VAGKQLVVAVRVGMFAGPSSNTATPLGARCDLLDCCRLSSSDIKDKTELLKGRKDIEREMERFKVWKS
jgi:hypothetical protein